jgi:hypothetical protein
MIEYFTRSIANGANSIEGAFGKNFGGSIVAGAGLIIGAGIVKAGYDLAVAGANSVNFSKARNWVASKVVTDNVVIVEHQPGPTA